MASLHIDFMNIIYSVCQYSCQVLIMRNVRNEQCWRTAKILWLVPRWCNWLL